MQVGSLVVCIKTPDIPERYKHFVKWLPTGDSKTIYTIRAIDSISATLEEGVIGIDPSDKNELSVSLDLLKEIQPPMSLEALLEEVMEKELFTV